MNLFLSHARKRFFSCPALFYPTLSLVALAPLGAKSANAATFTVTTRGDTRNSTEGCSTGGACSLREAIQAANALGNSDGVNTIQFDPKTFRNYQTILIKGSDLPAIETDLIISGPTAEGAGVTLTPRGVGSGTGLTIGNGRVRISSLFITDFDKAVDLRGGHTLIERSTLAFNNIGVLVESKRPGTLALQNCTVFRNGAGLYSINNSGSRGPVYNPATVNSCTIAGNSAGLVNGDLVGLSNSIVAVNDLVDITGPTSGDHNIIGGDIGSTGLDPEGLLDNGGPTPTLALLTYSPAINAGKTSLPVDQTGFRRDSQPDIGAFEFSNAAPFIDKVTPQNATDKVGQKRTFSVTVNDSNGDSDVASISLHINDQFDLQSGATLVFFPGTKSLYLLQNGILSQPIHIGSEAGRKDVLENGAIRIVGSEVSVSPPFQGNSVTLTVPATIKDGLIGKNTLFARVEDYRHAIDPDAAKYNYQGFLPVGIYTVETAQPNSAPTLSKLAPRVTQTTLFDTGIAVQQTFGFYAQDKDGVGDIHEMWFSAGQTPESPNGVTLRYEPRAKRLSLLSDDGKTYSSGQVGSDGLLENNQVRIVLANVRLAALRDGVSLGLIIPMQAKSGLIGKNSVWLKAKDSSGTTATGGDANGFVPSGLWVVNPQSSTTPPATAKDSAGAS